MNENDYIHLNKLIGGEQANLKDFEKESANFLNLVYPLKKLPEEALMQ